MRPTADGATLRSALIEAGVLRPEGVTELRGEHGAVLRLDAIGRDVAARRLQGLPVASALTDEQASAPDPEYRFRAQRRREERAA